MNSNRITSNSKISEGSPSSKMKDSMDKYFYHNVDFLPQKLNQKNGKPEGTRNQHDQNRK